MPRLASGVLKTRISNLGAYGGTASADLTVDASTANPSYALQTDLAGVRALPLLQGVADFDKLDGKMQAKIAVRSTGNSQRAIMSNMAGTVFVVFQDGAIRGLNVAQMIRSLTASTQSGWQENKEQATDLSQLSASFKIDKGQATTYDLNLVGPLVKMTGVGTIDLGTKQMGFRVEPKLVMTTEGQGRANEPVGFGIPVIIDGPWAQPRIYPEMNGILENPGSGLCQAERDGQRPVRPDGAGLGAAHRRPAGRRHSSPAPAAKPRGQQPGALGGNLGETLGNLLQQGLGGLGGQQCRTAPRQRRRKRSRHGPAAPAKAAAAAFPPPARRRSRCPRPPRRRPRPSRRRRRRPCENRCRPQDSQAMNEFCGSSSTAECQRYSRWIGPICPKSGLTMPGDSPAGPLDLC